MTTPTARPPKPLKGFGPIVFWAIMVVMALVLFNFFSISRFIWNLVREPEVVGSFFRLTVDFDYRGAPQRFEIIQGCDVRVINHRTKAVVFEPGLTPILYGRLMADGQLVAVQSPLACRRHRDYDLAKVEGIVPLMLVFPRGDRPDVAIAYLTDEAYQSPLSELKFRRAQITPVTAKEFLDFRALNDNALAQGARKAGRNGAITWFDAAEAGFEIADRCKTYLRVRLPDDLRELVRSYQPAHRPRYWAGAWEDPRQATRRNPTRVPDDEVWRRLYWSDVAVRSDGEDATPRELVQLLPESLQFGMPNKLGVVLLDFNRAPLGLPRYPGALYPAGPERVMTDPVRMGRYAAPRTQPEAGNREIVDVRAATRGMAFCQFGETQAHLVAVGGIEVEGAPGRLFFEDDTFMLIGQSLSPRRRGAL